MENRQWKYLILAEDNYAIRGTDNQKVVAAALDSGDMVIEVATCKGLERGPEGELIGISIDEQTWYVLS